MHAHKVLEHRWVSEHCTPGEVVAPPDPNAAGNVARNATGDPGGGAAGGLQRERQTTDQISAEAEVIAFRSHLISLNLTQSHLISLNLT